MVKVSRTNSQGLFNLLQHQKNWPSGGPPVLFDLRSADAYAARHLRGSHRVSLSEAGEILAPAKSWWDKVVCVYDEDPGSLEGHPVAQALVVDGLARELIVFSDAYTTFQAAFKFLCAVHQNLNAHAYLNSRPAAHLAW